MDVREIVSDLRDLADRLESGALTHSHFDVFSETDAAPGTRLFVPTGEQTLTITVKPTD